jgi:quercetin dioxygenase-like cupin family protein
MTTSTLLSKDQGVTDLWWPYGPSVGRYTIKQGGELVQLLIRESRGAATPLHVHRDYDETFYVIEGELTVFVGDGRLEARAGDFVVGPRGVPHAWIVTSESCELFVTAGAGLDTFFAEVAVPVTGSEPPPPAMPDNEDFARRMARRGIDLVGPPPALA